MKETIPNNLLKLLYQVEYLIFSEKKTLNEFLKEYEKLKTVYNEINKNGITFKK